MAATSIRTTGHGSRETESAEVCFSRVLEGEPGNRYARFHLARTLIEAGRSDSAREHLDQLIAGGGEYSTQAEQMRDGLDARAR